MTCESPVQALSYLVCFAGLDFRNPFCLLWCLSARNQREACRPLPLVLVSYLYMYREVLQIRDIQEQVRQSGVHHEVSPILTLLWKTPHLPFSFDFSASIPF